VVAVTVAELDKDSSIGACTETIACFDHDLKELIGSAF
jgi:hypothetical protein